MKTITIATVAALVAPVWSHYVLQYPASLGFDDQKEAQGPCGGFDAMNRTTVTMWPVSGQPVSLLSTHNSATWIFRAALMSAPTKFMDMQPNISQTGLGNICFTAIKAPQSMTGKDGVVQILQNGPDGLLYQCAAVTFTAAAPATVPASCKNASGIQASLMPVEAGSTLSSDETRGGSGSSAGGSMPGMSMPSSGTQIQSGYPAGFLLTAASLVVGFITI